MLNFKITYNLPTLRPVNPQRAGDWATSLPTGQIREGASVFAGRRHRWHVGGGWPLPGQAAPQPWHVALLEQEP